MAILKAQASLESLVIIAIGICFVSLMFFLALNYLSDSARISQTQDAVQRLISAADYVYAVGPNSKEYVDVYLPPELLGWSITGKGLIITVPTMGGTTDVIAYSKANLTGSLPTYRGRQSVLVEYLPNGVVRIGPGVLVCSPPLIDRYFNAGGNGTDTITVTSILDYNVTNLHAGMSGATDLVSAGSVVPDALSVGQNASLLLTYNIPLDKDGGVYGAIVTVSDSEGDECTTQLTISVNTGITCPAQCIRTHYSNGTCRSSPAECIANNEDYHPEFDPTCAAAPSTPDCCCWPRTDKTGPISNITIMNGTDCAGGANSTNVTVTGTCSDAGNGDSYITSAQMRVDSGAWQDTHPVNGQSFNSSPVVNVYSVFAISNNGAHIVELKCTDSAHQESINYYPFEVSNCGYANDSGPVIITMVRSDTYPTTLVDIRENMTASDVDFGNDNIAYCEVKIDNGEWKSVPADDGAYDSPAENFSYDVGELSSGMHMVSAYCVDVLGYVGPTRNDSFGVSASDLVLVIDRSGSMADAIVGNMTYSDNTIASVNSTTSTIAKTLPVTSNASTANISIELMTDSNCNAYYEADVNGSPIITEHNTRNVSWQTFTYANVPVSQGAFNISLKLRGVVPQSVLSVSKDGGTFANDSSTGTVAWLNPVNAKTSDNIYAVANLSSNGVSQYLKVTNFSPNIPTNSTINGIVVNVEKKESGSGISDNHAYLVKNNATVGSDRAVSGSWSSSDSVQTYGNASDLWGTNWSASDVSSGNFGFALSAKSSSSSARNASVDHINMTIYYSLPNVSCQVSNRNFSFKQTTSQTKLQAVQIAAKAFVDLMDSSTQVSLVSFSTTATTNKQLALMTPSNKSTLKTAIDALSATGNTCTECGLDNTVNELVSTRGRYPNVVRVIVLLSDGQSNTCASGSSDSNGGCAYGGAAYARSNNATAYTIGFGTDANATELTNIALLTYGRYYYAPDAATLLCIYQHIGQLTPCQ